METFKLERDRQTGESTIIGVKVCVHVCMCLCYIDKSETFEHWQENGDWHNHIAVPGLIICLLIQNFSSKSTQYHVLQKNVSRNAAWRSNKVNCFRRFPPSPHLLQLFAPWVHTHFTWVAFLCFNILLHD